MSTFQSLVGTVVFGTLLLALVWAMVRVAMWALPPEPLPPHQAVDRLGKLVDDETRARLHQRMHSAR